MARKINAKSIRQRAFKLLDKLTNVKREKAIEKLKQKFSIGESYAATLHGSHRTINKENGTMKQVYSVRDVKDGKHVNPYLKVENVFNSNHAQFSTPAQAKQQYALVLKIKIEQAKLL